MLSNTDAKLNEYRLNHVQTLKDNQSSEETSDIPVCTWHFYEEKKNDALHQIGYRIKLTHQKV